MYTYIVLFAIISALKVDLLTISLISTEKFFRQFVLVGQRDIFRSRFKLIFSNDNTEHS